METILILRAAEKLFVVAGGVLSLYLGYSLFIKGVSGRASLKAQHNQATLQLLNAAPGIFFALFGMVVLAVSLWRQTTVLFIEPVPGGNVAAMEWPGPLPGSAEEAEALAKLLAEAGLEPLETPEKLNYRMLRLSSHASGIDEPDSATVGGDE